MRETAWVKDVVVERLNRAFSDRDPKLEILPAYKLPYADEVRSYKAAKPQKRHTQAFQTDMLVREVDDKGVWKPRVVIEAKLFRVTTHDAITYSQKATTHKQIHPYLRYGIMIGNRKKYPLPGRLFRHGAHFDFMLSWVGFEPTDNEMTKLVNVIEEEVKASQDLEEIIYRSRSKNREHYTFYHKPLKLNRIEKTAKKVKGEG